MENLTSPHAKALTYRHKSHRQCCLREQQYGYDVGKLHIYYDMLYFSSLSTSVYACAETHIIHNLLTKSYFSKNLQTINSNVSAKQLCMMNSSVPKNGNMISGTFIRKETGFQICCGQPTIEWRKWLLNIHFFKLNLIPFAHKTKHWQFG